MNWLLLLPLLVQGPPLRAPRLEAAVLQERATGLPRAKPGTWSGWAESAGLEPELQEPYMQAVRAWREGDSLRALRACWPVLQVHPDHPAFLHLAGHAQFLLRRHGECAELLGRFLAHCPQHVDRTRHLGHALNELGRVTEAIAHYGLVLAAQPEDVEARRGRALALWRDGRVEAALLDLDQVLGARSDHAEAWVLRARILHDDERSAEALEAADSALALDAFLEEACYLRAAALAELDRPDESATAHARWKEVEQAAAAARPLEGQLLLTPFDLDRLHQLAVVRLAAGDRRRAKDTLERLARAARRAQDATQLSWAGEQLARLAGLGAGAGDSSR